MAEEQKEMGQGMGGSEQNVEEKTEGEERNIEQSQEQPAGRRARWWVLWVRGGKEEVIKKELEKLKEKDDRIEEIFVPEEETKKKVGGKEKKVKKNITSGYIYIKMRFDEDLWKKIREIPNVGVLLGDIGRPMPVSEHSIEKLKKGVEMGRVSSIFSISVGDRVRVKSGVFKGFTGVVESISEDGKKARLLVSIFGRRTPVEIEISDLEKE